MIQKLGHKTYAITDRGRALLPQTGDDRGPRIRPPAVGAMPAWARRMINDANYKNGADGPRFSEQDLMVLWRRCHGRCAITRLDFSGERVSLGRAKRAFAPSLDRIDPEGPYTVDNCRLVMVAVNFALNAWGEEVYLKLARAAVATADDGGSGANEDPGIEAEHARTPE